MVVAIRRRSNPKKKSENIETYIHKNIRFIASILVIVIIIFGLVYVVLTLNNSSQNTRENFTFTSVDGDEIHLSSYRGKIIILDMWATWCSPCQSQMTELKKLYEQYPREKLEIMSVDVDTSETFTQIQDFKDSFKEQMNIELNWVFGKDDGSIWEKYKMSKGGIPTLCIFNQEGKLCFHEEGARDAVTLNEEIADLLK